MAFTEEDVTLALAPRPLRFYETIDSTNESAKAWLLNDAPHGAVIVADEQNAGKGRLGRAWHTPSGVAIAVSIILKQKQQHIARMNMVGTLAVLHTLLATHQIDQVEIKWSNDVLVNGKKICGILPEAVWNGDILAGIVIGIGLNVRNNFIGTSLESSATSIEQETGHMQNRVALLAVLLFQFDQWLQKIETDEIRRAYKSHMRMLNNPVSVRSGEEIITGVAHDIDQDGALLIQQGNGEVVRVTAGETTVLSRGS